MSNSYEYPEIGYSSAAMDVDWSIEDSSTVRATPSGIDGCAIIPITNTGEERYREVQTEFLEMDLTVSGSGGLHDDHSEAVSTTYVLHYACKFVTTDGPTLALFAVPSGTTVNAAKIALLDGGGWTHWSGPVRAIYNNASGNIVDPATDDYFYLPGVPGGQVGYGGSEAGDDLALGGNSVDGGYVDVITGELRIKDSSDDPTFAFLEGSTERASIEYDISENRFRFSSAESASDIEFDSDTGEIHQTGGSGGNSYYYMGSGETGDRSCLFSMIGDDTYTGGGFTIQRNAGAHAGTTFTHRGNGVLEFVLSEASSIKIKSATGNDARLNFYEDTTAGGAIYFDQSEDRMVLLTNVTDGEIDFIPGTTGAVNVHSVGGDPALNFVEAATYKRAKIWYDVTPDHNLIFETFESGSGIALAPYVGNVYINQITASTNVALFLDADTDNDSYVVFRENGSEKGYVFYDASENTLRVQSTGDQLWIEGSSGIRAYGDWFLLYNDGTGTAYYYADASGGYDSGIVLRENGAQRLVTYCDASANRIDIQSKNSHYIRMISDGELSFYADGVFHFNHADGSTNTIDVTLGAGGSGNRYSHIDLIGDDTYTDYGLRVIRRNGGANTESEIRHRGSGDFTLDAQDGGDITLEPLPNFGYVVLYSRRTLTGHPTGREGMIYYNTYDNGIYMYADGAWRTLATW